MPFEPRDAGHERGERRGRPHDEHGQRVGAAAGLEIAFAQVQQVAARLDLACAPQVRRIDGERREWIRAGNDGMVRENRTELEREGVERLLELVRGDEQRRREPRLVPRVDADGARAQIAWRHGVDDRQRVRRRRVVTVCGMRGVRAFLGVPACLRALAVDDE